jgi:hypothetical protein
MRMTDDEYRQTQRKLMRLAVEVQGLDFQGFLERIAEAESAGPVLDPTLYRRGAAALAAVKEVALAGRGMKKAYEAHPRELMPAVLDAFTAEELARAGIV